jgi:hypothetical protein
MIRKPGIVEAMQLETVTAVAMQCKTEAARFTNKVYAIVGTAGLFYRVASGYVDAIEAWFDGSQISLVPFDTLEAELQDAGFQKGLPF